MYGIGYGYSGNAGITATGAPASNWGMYVASNGVSKIFMSSDTGNIYINGSYNGAGTGLTGTAAGLSIGGNAATATVAANSVRAISAGSYGSTEVYGSNGAWSGIRFNTPNSVFMVRDSDSYSGIFKNNTTWTWSFDGAGALATGSVPWSLVSGKPSTVAGYGITDFVSGTSANPVAADATTTNGHYYTNANIALFGQADGSLYTQSYSSSWVTQIFQDFRTGQIALRGKNNGVWQAWRVGLDSSNYNTYAPTLTGVGASGTWGISVTGNAATATTAGTVTTAAQPAITSVGTLTDAYTSGWFRNTNAGMGLYNQATARHFYSESSAYWRMSSDTGFKFYAGDNTTLRGYVYHDTTGFGLLGNLGGWGIKIPVGSNVPEATSGFRSTIVYDLDNAAYYVDPASTSNMNTVNATAFIYSSDRNLKKNIVGLTGSLEKITQLNGYSFDWKSDGRKDLGVIAQEVEKIYPELVATNPSTGFKAVEYGNLVAPIIEAIKELSAKVDALFQKYADQSAKIGEQEKRLEELEKKFQKLERAVSEKK